MLPDDRRLPSPRTSGPPPGGMDDLDRPSREPLLLLLVEQCLDLPGRELRQLDLAQVGFEVEPDRLFTPHIGRGPDIRLHRLLQPFVEELAHGLPIIDGHDALGEVIESGVELALDLSPGATVETLADLRPIGGIAEREPGFPAGAAFADVAFAVSSLWHRMAFLRHCRAQCPRPIVGD